MTELERLADELIAIAEEIAEHQPGDDTVDLTTAARLCRDVADSIDAAAHDGRTWDEMPAPGQQSREMQRSTREPVSFHVEADRPRETPVNITVYLPDDVGDRAKAAKLNLSGILREAVTETLHQRAWLEAARDGMAEQRVETSDGRYGESPVILRFTGKLLASDDGTTVWLIEDGRVLVEDPERYSEFADAPEFADWVHEQGRDNLGANAEAALRNAVAALGITPVVDL